MTVLRRVAGGAFVGPSEAARSAYFVLGILRFVVREAGGIRP
jgi:hypothetical protein